MDSLWDATRGSTPGRLAVDQAKRYVLLMRMGMMMTRSSKFKPVPRLMVWSLGSSRGEVSSTSLRRTSRPTLGSRSSSDRAMPKSGGRSMWLIS